MALKRNAGAYIGAVILAGVVTSALTLFLSGLGFGTNVNTISSVLAFLTVTTTIYEKLLKPILGDGEPQGETTTKETTKKKEQGEESPSTGEPQDLSLSRPARRSAQRAKDIQSNNDLREVGNGSYPENTRKIINWLQGILPFNWMKVEALLFMGGVASTIWIFLVLMKFISTAGYSSPWWFQPLLQAFPLAVTVSDIYELLIVPIVIIFITSWYFGTKKKTTCDICGSPFALKSLNRYHHPDNKYLRKDTDEDGNPISWYEIDGHRVLYCEVHEQLVARDIDWKEE
ncbi:hypothetical protein [Halorussus ruber]|uniref:hypothetical protein n=1 Tax=Halorussus ruber TaxID=1126238 RepID=UPI0010919269|nr:hypothetical protein [Halorussus ruber]